MFMTAASESEVPELNVRLVSFLGSALVDGNRLVPMAVDDDRSLFGASKDCSEIRECRLRSWGLGLAPTSGGGTPGLRMDAMRSGMWVTVDGSGYMVTGRETGRDGAGGGSRQKSPNV